MTELREGILRNEIQTLEAQANTLEQMVYFRLAGLKGEPEEMDSRILRSLQEMDRLQAEIDALTGRLKAEGYWEPINYADGKYIYTRPKAKPKPKPKPIKPHKVYSSETTDQRKKREAAAEKKRLRERQRSENARRAAEKAAIAAEKQRLKDERQAEREAVRNAPKPPKEARPKAERPKAQPKPRVSKPRKPAESREIVLLKKRRLNANTRMNDLENKYEPKRAELEGRVRYFEEKLIELAEVSWEDRGHQKRNTARGHLRNAQKQLEELPATFEAKRKKFEEQLTKLDQEITEQYRKEAS